MPRRVRPVLEQYVTELFEELHEKVDRKMLEIMLDFETQIMRTFRFRDEQSTLTMLATSAAASPAATAASPAATDVHAAEPGPPPGPVLEMPWVSAMMEDISEDPMANALCANMKFDWEEIIDGQYGLDFEGYESFSGDSAYFSESISGSTSGGCLPGL
jgi:hypothetical protein